jgi:nucleoside 2-deoxyribosyltransferase
MKVYLSGHMKKPGETVDWRDYFIGHFNEIVKQHYKKKKVYPLPSVQFVTPLAKAIPEVNATRDMMLMNISDIAVAYLNLNMGRCLGAMFEIGYMKAHNKPVVLVNVSSDVLATKFIEMNSNIVAYDLKTGAEYLFMILKDIEEVT